MNDGSLFKEPLPLGVLLLIDDEPLSLDEDVDNCDTSFFQKFILAEQSDAKILYYYYLQYRWGIVVPCLIVDRGVD